jgi:hypothetical protein
MSHRLTQLAVTHEHPRSWPTGGDLGIRFLRTRPRLQPMTASSSTKDRQRLARDLRPSLLLGFGHTARLAAVATTEFSRLTHRTRSHSRTSSSTSRRVGHQRAVPKEFPQVKVRPKRKRDDAMLAGLGI